MTSDQKFEKRDVKVGITDGINVEIISELKLMIKLRFGIKLNQK